MANDGPAPTPWLASDLDALEDAYDLHVRDLIAQLHDLLDG